MAEILSLNKARKVRAKEQALSEAAANRAKHGRTKAERAREDAEA